MPYAIRNTIILTVLLVIVIVGFIIANSKYVKQKEELTIQYNRLAEQLSNLKIANPDYNDIERITEEYQALRREDQKTGKVIPKENNPTLSYLYLLNICDKFCPGLDFKYSLEKSGMIGNTSYNSFFLSGEANIYSLYPFIFQIEKNIMFYTIERIFLSEVIIEEEEEGMTTLIPNMVSFEIMINAYYDEQIIQTIDNVKLRNLRYKNINYNPFYTRVHEPRVDIDQEKYLNLDYSQMIGLTPEKVFLRDNNENVLIIFPGDKVAYGYLDRINWKEQSAVFKINRVGITIDKILYWSKD
ncbi:MAG: hypothetical protein KAT74_07440 [Candidatus Cloacimonetes bacterium]|nr:hypothetical protein [Candidatus Cloacimonadota bacterium]